MSGRVRCLSKSSSDLNKKKILESIEVGQNLSIHPVSSRAP